MNKQTHNQDKSRLAAKFNTLATVDFSSASDTISKDLVEMILPKRWYHLLDGFRSSCGTLDGSPFLYEKFSSMGNGFTFELETLIFYCIALYCCKLVGCSCDDVSVYGDDVILPSVAFDAYCSISADLGFTVNQSKSYSTGYYRESCGAHWWGGTNIKPIFQKETLNEKSALVKAANSVRRFAHSRTSGYGCDNSLFQCWRFLSDILGKKFPRVPEGFGDVGLIENLDESDWTKPKHGIEGYHVKCYVSQVVNMSIDHHGLLLTRLKNIGESTEILLMSNEGLNPLQSLAGELSRLGSMAYQNDVPIPFRTRQARKRLLFPRWHYLGPWL